MKNPELVQIYRELDRDCARLSYRQVGDDTEKTSLFIPNDVSMEKLWRTWRELKEKVNALEEPDPVFSLVKHHLQDFLEEQEFSLQGMEEHPESALLYAHWTIENTSRLNRKPDEERCESLVSRLHSLCEVSDAYLEVIKARYDEAGQNQVAKTMRASLPMLEEMDGKLKEYFPTFTEDQIQRTDAAIKEYCEMLERLAVELASENAPAEKVVKDDLSITVKMDPEEYRTLLKKRMGVSLDELLAWHKEEMEKTRADVFDIASKLDIPEPAPKTMQEVNDILFKYEGPCDSPEEMFERADTYLKRTRALAHEFVNLPEDEQCICAMVPDTCRDSYPWGGYEGGDFSVKPLRGQMFLNQHNYKNVTDGWIKLNSLHEAYPGHHVQYVRAEVDKTPETVKIGAKMTPILEGTCLRTERAFQFIYGEDPFFPLFVAYRRHHASTRIYVDLMMYYYGATLEEVVQIYEKELGFDRVTARGQVRAQQNMPGYFTCYYYGMKKITEWEETYKFTKKEYTELLFSAGYISIDRLEELIKLSPEDRERYFHDFSSLLRE